MSETSAGNQTYFGIKIIDYSLNEDEYNERLILV